MKFHTIIERLDQSGEFKQTRQVITVCGWETAVDVLDDILNGLLTAWSDRSTPGDRYTRTLTIDMHVTYNHNDRPRGGPLTIRHVTYSTQHGAAVYTPAVPGGVYVQNYIHLL